MDGVPDLAMPQLGSSPGSSNVGLQRTDLDAACMMMDLRDLSGLIGEIIRPANRKVSVRDSRDFNFWLHVISDPVVVKVYAGRSDVEREEQKRLICQELRRSHGLALTVSPYNLVLVKSHVNVPLQALVKSLRACGHVECQVCFFGMKWAFPKAQPKIDHLVECHIALHGTAAAIRRNQFDIGFVLPATSIGLVCFGRGQLGTQCRFRNGKIHEMFNISNYGALEFHLLHYEGIGKIKVYHELCHEVMSAIPKDNLDDMPKTVRTMRTRLEQLEKLLEAWERCGLPALEERLLGTRIEVTIVGVHTVGEAYHACVSMGLLHLQGIERLLGGPFQIQNISVQTVLSGFRSKMEVLRGLVRGGNEREPTVAMRSALTRARQALGWSGKNMHNHLQDVRTWAQARLNQPVRIEHPEFHYDGWEMDAPRLRPLIQDFLDNAHWQSHSRSSDRSEPLMLQKKRGGGFWKMHGVYVDRVTAARHFITRFEERWREHVKSLR